MKTFENRDGWTAERDDALRKLWDEGLTGTQIAQRMHTTRNSILARARRIRCANRVSEEAKACTRVIRKRNKTNFNFALGREQGREPLAGIAKDTFVCRSVDVTPEHLRIPIEALDDTRCKWAHGEAAPFMFCGAPSRPGLRWCETHARVVFVTPQPAQVFAGVSKNPEPQLSNAMGQLEAVE